MKNKIEPTVAAVPVVSTPAMVQVTAPSSLEAGYTFDAVYNGEVFPVTVPTGGVQAGQTFAVPFVPVVEAVAVPIDDESPQQQHDESTPILPTLSPTRNANRNSPQAPLGTWKTSWYDCLSEGLCHPSLLNAYFFPQILMGQVLTRMKLNWCGYPIGGESYKYTTYIWIFLTVFLIFQKLRFSDCLGEVSNNVWYDPLQIFADDDDDDDDDDDGWFRTRELSHRHRLHHSRKHINQIDPAHDAIPNSGCRSDRAETLKAIQWVWFWATTIVLIRLRGVVRRAHGISQRFPLEDCFCAVCLGCCTVAQLARQTANYTEQRAYCCTGTGLAVGWFGHRQEELERRHLHGHHLVHAHSCDSNDRRRQQQQEHHVV